MWSSRGNHGGSGSLRNERGTLSVDKARRLIGYEPRFPLEKGFLRYIDWYKGLAKRMPEMFATAKG